MAGAGAFCTPFTSTPRSAVSPAVTRARSKNARTVTSLHAGAAAPNRTTAASAVRRSAIAPLPVLSRLALDGALQLADDLVGPHLLVALAVEQRGRLLGRHGAVVFLLGLRGIPRFGGRLLLTLGRRRVLLLVLALGLLLLLSLVLLLAASLLLLLIFLILLVLLVLLILLVLLLLLLLLVLLLQVGYLLLDELVVELGVQVVGRRAEGPAICRQRFGPQAEGRLRLGRLLRRPQAVLGVPDVVRHAGRTRRVGVVGRHLLEG